MKHKTFRPPVTSREQPPKLHQSKDGVQVLCPFCHPPHPLIPGVESPCGTTLRVTAIQTVIPARTVRDKDLTCLKCHQAGKGEMVRYGNGFIHLVDCMPGVRLLTEHPPCSKLAERVYKLPVKLRGLVERYTGQVQEVNALEDDSKVVGYFFLKAKA